MKRLAVLAVVAAALLAPAAASAHPLGNFTINRFSRVEVSGHRLYVRYVLDMAEIPTFQARRIDAGAYARRIARNAQLEVDGKAVQLVPLGTALAHPRGAAGLHTTRLEVILAGPTLSGKASISYRDNNYKDRIGWKEIVVGPTARSTSDELRVYPKNLLQSPLDITSAKTDLAPASGPDVPPALSSGKTLEAPDRDQRAAARSLVLVVMVAVVVRVAPVPVAAAEDRGADRDDEHARDEVQPRVQLLGDDEGRERESDKAECEDADRVRYGRDRAERRSVPRGAALADEVGGNDRLPVTG